MAQYGYMAKIGADTSGLQSALKNINSQLKETDREINATNRSIRAAEASGGNSFEMLAQKSTELMNAVAMATIKVNQLKSVEEQMRAAVAGGSISAEQYREYQREISDTESCLRSYQSQLDEVNNAMLGLNDQTEDAKRRQRELSNGMLEVRAAASQVASDLEWLVNTVKGFTDAALGAVKSAAEYSLSVGQSFDAAMSQTAAYSGAAAEELEQLRQSAKDAGATTSKTATESAQALGYMALAGWDTTQMLEGLMPILRASEAGGADLARTSDLVTDSMSAMGIQTSELSHYLDVVSQAQSSCNTTMTGLLEAYINCGGTLRNLNVPIEESATLLGTLANRGKKAAEAGTSLNSILVNLMGANRSSDAALKELGITAWDEEGNFKGLTNVLLELNDALASCTEQKKSFFEAKIGGKTQMDTLQAMLSGLNEEYFDLYETLSNCEGAMETTAQTMQNNLTGSITIMKSALEGVGIEFYSYLEEPLRKAVEAVTEVLGNLNQSISRGELSQTLSALSEKLAVLLDKLIEFAKDKGIPFVMDAIESLIDTLTWLTENFDGVVVAVKTLGAAFGTLYISKIVTDIGVLVTTVTTLKNTMGAGTVAAEALGFAMKAIPYVAIATAAIAAGTAIASWIDNASAARVEMRSVSEATDMATDSALAHGERLRELNKELEENKKKYEDDIEKIDEAKKIIEECTDENGNLTSKVQELDNGLDDLYDAIGTVNGIFGTNLEIVNGQIQGYKDLKENYDDYIESLRQGAMVEGMRPAYVEAVTNRENITAEIEAAQKERELAYDAWNNYYSVMAGTDAFDEDYAAYLTNRKNRADANLKNLEATAEAYDQTIEKYEDIVNPKRPGEWAQNDNLNDDHRRQAEKQVPPSNKTDEEKKEADKRVQAEYDAEMEKLENNKKLHKEGIKDDEAYYTAKKAIVDKYAGTSLEDTEDYWKAWEDVNRYYSRKSGGSGSSSSSGGKKPGTVKTIDDEFSSFYAHLQAMRDDGLEDSEYYRLLDEKLSSDAKYEADAYSKYRREVREYKEKQQEEENKALKEKAKKDIDELTQLYRDGDIEREEFLEKYKEWQKEYNDVSLDGYDTEKVGSAMKARAKSDFDTLVKMLDDGIISREEFNEMYSELEKEWSEDSIDIKKYTSQKIAEIDREEMEEWKKQVKEARENIEEEYKELAEKRKSIADSMGTDSLYDTVTDKNGKERRVFRDLKADTKAIREYISNYKKLMAMEGIPEGLRNELAALSMVEMNAVMGELSSMNANSRNRYFADYAEWEKAKNEAAAVVTADEEAALKIKSEKTMAEVYGNMPDQAYEYGKQTMEAFNRGIIDGAGGAAGIGLISQLFWKSEPAPASGAVGGASMQAVNVIPINTPIQIRVGDEVIETTFEKCLANSGIYSRSNYML